MLLNSCKTAATQQLLKLSRSICGTACSIPKEACSRRRLRVTKLKHKVDCIRFNMIERSSNPVHTFYPQALKWAWELDGSGKAVTSKVFDISIACHDFRGDSCSPPSVVRG